MVEDLTTTEGLSEKLNHKEFTIIECWSFRCEQSRHIAPLVSRLAFEKNENCSVFKVNFDMSPELVSMLEIYSIPTIFLYRKGELIEKFDETVQYNDMLTTINKVN